MTPDRRDELVRLRRARDEIDRRFAERLDVRAIAATAYLSPAHFSRRFRATYGETPHAYLQSRRLERAAALLRAGASVTDAAVAVGFASLGSFSSRFTAAMGATPSAYRRAATPPVLPACVLRTATRPRRRIEQERRSGREPGRLPSAA